MIGRIIRAMFDDEKAAPTQRKGLFSTHIERGESLRRSLDDVVFRVKAGALKAHSPEGVALDSADCGGSCDSLNEAFTLGQAGMVPDGQLGWYASQGFPGYQILATMAQQWLVAKAVAMPARDAMRNGYQIKVGDGSEDTPPEVTRAIEEAARKFAVAQNAVEHARFTRIFGIRLTLFLVDTPDPAAYYGAPFNLDAVRPGSYRGMTQIDPYWCAPELSAQAASNPTAQDFYVPTWWVINGMRVHRSHLVVGMGEQVADVLKPSYLFGGVSVVQRIYERVYAAERTANEAPQLAMTKRLRTLKTDLSQATANQAALETVLSRRAQLLSNYGTDVIDKETDDVLMFDTSLSDLDSVIMTQYQIVAAIAECPATKLLGTTPKGFNATGEYEEASYHETLRGLQAELLQPVIERHHQMLMRSEIAPRFGLDPDTPVTISWNPCDTPTAKERAEVRAIEAQTAKTYAEIGAVDAYDVRDRLIADPESGFSGMEAIERPDDLDVTGLEDGTPPNSGA